MPLLNIKGAPGSWCSSSRGLGLTFKPYQNFSKLAIFLRFLRKFISAIFLKIFDLPVRVYAIKFKASETVEKSLEIPAKEFIFRNFVDLQLYQK